ncbi:hypothetical protein GF312_19425 [Candidatus Poribacteria bacterium]|nr:hypothetical protein [Candidatus Poribacteria bacterium]
MRLWIRFRTFKRYRQILNVLVKNGFGGLLEALKLKRSYRRKRQPKDQVPSPRAKRLRLVLEELGPTFIKMGQMLSTRPDIVPADIYDELQKLQDQVPPVEVSEIISEIESELKTTMDSIFEEFDQNPLAAASIGQVHKAVLKDGRKVAVKVQRPEIWKMVEEDIEILKTLAELAERHIPEAKFYSPVSVVKEFAKSIRQEMDYTLEARNMERFAKNFVGDESVHIPKVYWEFSTRHILTMELIKGTKVSHVEELKRLGINTKDVARRGAKAYLKQILIHRFFHGDPHPGNLIVMQNGTIGFLDFGIVGRLSPEIVTHLNNMLIAIVREDSYRTTEELIKLSVVDEDVEMEELRFDLAELVDKYYDVSLNQFQMGDMMRELMEISARYRIKINRQLNLLGKVLAGVEGIGRQLDPDFNLLPIIEPFAKRLIAQKMSPKEILDKTSQMAKDYADFISALPRDLKVALEKAKNGKLRIEFKHIGLENFTPELERSTSRLAFAMIIAALVVSSALIVRSDIKPVILGVPVIGILGYLIAAVSGIWLLIVIIRNRTLR